MTRWKRGWPSTSGRTRPSPQARLSVGLIEERRRTRYLDWARPLTYCSHKTLLDSFMVEAAGVELEPLCGRLSPQAKS